MDLAALKSLPPEELAALREGLAGMDESTHSDAPEDMAMLQPLVQAIEMIAEKVDSVDKRLDECYEKVDRMTDHYFNDFIGGIKSLYDDNARSMGVEALRTKYGGMFEPHAGVAKVLMGDKDLMSELYDYLHDNYDKEEFDPDSAIQDVLKHFEEMAGKMREATGPAKVVAVHETEEPEGPDDEEEKIRETVKALKGRR